jgi:hypothetical protein
MLLVAAIGLAACGSDTPNQPSPNPQPNPQPQPNPANSAPTIESIVVQGTRPGEPPNFADVTEIVDVSATVRDAETAVDQLQFVWSSTVGSFAGSGARVRWQAPDNAATPVTVRLTLEVVERYGQGAEHRVSRTADVALHHSSREVGDMARQFLIDFSETGTNRDASHIMRNFGPPSGCPAPNEVTSERDQVEDHFNNFVMHAYSVGQASVTTNFGGRCHANLPGDACVSVPVTWDSTDRRTNSRRTTRGVDHLTAVYSQPNSRWWLCSSRLEGTSSLGHRFYIN